MYIISSHQHRNLCKTVPNWVHIVYMYVSIRMHCTWNSLWKYSRDSARLLSGTSMSWMQWYFSYMAFIVLPCVRFSSDIFGGIIQPNSHLNTGWFPNGIISCKLSDNDENEWLFIIIYSLSEAKQKKHSSGFLMKKETVVRVYTLPGETPSWRDIKPMDTAWDDICHTPLDRDEWIEWTA